VVGAKTAGKGAFEQSLDLREGEHATSAIHFGTSDLVRELPAEPTPTPLIVDPNSNDASAKTTPPPRNRWVLEPGLFLGGMSVNPDHAQATDGGAQIGVTDTTPASTTPAGTTKQSCRAVGCTYALPARGGPLL